MAQMNRNVNLPIVTFRACFGKKISILAERIFCEVYHTVSQAKTAA